MKKKNKKNNLIIIGILLLIIIIILTIISKKENNIEKHLLLAGFTSIDNKVYEKKLTKVSNEEYFKSNKNMNTKYLYYYSEDKILKEEILERNNNITRTLDSSYYYDKDLIKYTYEITYYDNILEYKGSYKNNKFDCNLFYKYKNDNYDDDMKDTSCKIIENYIKDFYENIDSYLRKEIVNS